MVINKFPNREVYEKIKEKGSLGADDVNVLEDYPGLEWKGEYSSTATYVKGDIVYYENMLYVMVSASVIGAIPGIDNDWIDFAKRSVTSSDVTNALGFTPADSTKVLPLSGGTLTGNLTGKYITGTWLQATDAGHLATTPTKIPVFDDKGWIYYRTPAEILKDIGASSGYTLTEADKTEIAGKVTADGLEFTLVDLPAGGSSGSGSGGALKAMSAVSGYIGIPAAELPKNGIVWMCIADGATNQEYYSGTITMQGGALSSNNMVCIFSNGVIQLNQVAQVSGGIAIYGMSASAYTGVYQVVGAGGDSGESLSLGMTSAAVGQIAKISAVDANGVPTAWEPVDMPSGGGSGEFRVIRQLILSEQTDRVDITVDDDGKTFELSEIYVNALVQSYNDTNEQVTFLPNGGWTTNDPYITSVTKTSKSSDTWKTQMIFHAVFATGGELLAYQLSAGSDNPTSKFMPGRAVLTKVSIVGKFAVGCKFTVIGR